MIVSRIRGRRVGDGLWDGMEWEGSEGRGCKALQRVTLLVGGQGRIRKRVPMR